MMPDRRLLGVVSLYRLAADGRDFDRDGARFLADATGAAILERFERTDSAALVRSTRERLHVATGMVVVQLRIAPADALALLRAHAFAHGVTIAHVTDEVVARRLDFRNGDRQVD